MVDLLWLGVVFLIISLIAYALGARGFAWFSAGIARTLFWIFLILFAITLLFRLLA